MAEQLGLRLSAAELHAVHVRPDIEVASVREVVRRAIRDYFDARGRAELVDRVLDRALPRYAQAIERLAR